MDLLGVATVGAPWQWGVFLLTVFVMLGLDLGVFHRKAHVVGVREAAIWSVVWVALSALFGVAVWAFFGSDRAVEYTTGYLIEKALAIDNVFVFVIIFGAFGVPPLFQHRVLFWGILGALVMRAVFVVAGGAFLARFTWAIYVFGGVLLITGIKLFLQRNDKMDPANSAVVRLFRRFVPMTDKVEGPAFVVERRGRRLATPLLLALVAVEVTDLIFAVDSIPAIFAVTNDPFIVFTSNIFAILGLRSMYFLLAGVIERFHLLKIGLSAVLVFVGAKMMSVDIFKVPVAASLAVITILLGGSIVASLIWPAGDRRLPPALPKEA